MTPRSRMHGALTGAVIALTFALTWSLVKVPTLEDKADSAVGEVNTLKPQVQTLTENQGKLVSGLDEANRRLVALGKPPVPVPTVTPQPAPIQPDEFTAAEAMAVRQIVAEQLSQQKVSITPAEISQIARTAAALIPKPADGKTPADAQIRPAVVAAVAAYCVGDKCVGPAGRDGPKGDKGDKGDPAPKVTDEELLASSKLALAAYCGLESQPCKGPQGEPGATVTGPPGSEGKQGRGIAGTTCQENGQWLFRYSDGSTETVDGPCRAVAVPTTEPSPATKRR